MPRRRPRYYAAGQEIEERSALGVDVAAEVRRQYLARRAELAPLPPASTMTGISEKAFQVDVVQLARQLGWYVYHPQLSKYSERGWPDLSLLHLTHGAALFIECKSDVGHLTEEQVVVIDRMRAAGLAVLVARPAEGLERLAARLARPGVEGGSAHV